MLIVSCSCAKNTAALNLHDVLLLMCLLLGSADPLVVYYYADQLVYVNQILRLKSHTLFQEIRVSIANQMFCCGVTKILIIKEF
jgi:hypothetical protein